MKLLTIALFILSLNSFASLASLEEQKEIVNYEAKESRRALHIAGHDHVGTSTPSMMTLEELNEDYSNRDHYYSSLDSDEYSQLYRCYHSKSCVLWVYDASSEYYSGWGSERHFVLINPNTLAYDTISYESYSE